MITAGFNLAQQWATDEEERLRLQAEADKVRIELDKVKIRLEAAVKDLRTGVGSAFPHKLYDIGGGKIVMVSVAGGVQLVQVEKGVKNG